MKIMKFIAVSLILSVLLSSCGLESAEYQGDAAAPANEPEKEVISEIDNNPVPAESDSTPSSEEQIVQAERIVIDLTPYIHIEESGRMSFKSEQFFYDYTDKIEFKDDKSKNAYSAYYSATDITPINAFYSTVLNEGRFLPDYDKNRYMNGDTIEVRLNINRDALSMYFNIDISDKTQLIAENTNDDCIDILRARFFYEEYPDYGDIHIEAFHETEDCLYINAGYGGAWNLFAISKAFPHNLYEFSSDYETVYNYGDNMNVDPYFYEEEKAEYIVVDGYPDPMPAWDVWKEYRNSFSY